MEKKRILIFILFLTMLLSVPIATIGISFFMPSDGSLSHLISTVLASYISNSLILAIGVGIGVSFLGLSLSWLIAMYEFPGKKFFEWGLLLPMAIPAYIVAYSYTGLFEFGGPIQNYLGELFQTQKAVLPPIRSIGGAILVFSLVLYPYLYLICRSSFLQQSSTFFELGRSLGYKPAQVFFKLSLPLVRPAYIGGLSLVLMETLADFGTVQFFGIPTFTTGIYRTWFGMDSSVAAAQLSGFLLLFIFGLMAVEKISRKKLKFHHTSQKINYRKPEKLVGRQGFMAAFYCSGVLFFSCILPFSQLIVGAVSTWDSVVDARFWDIALNSFSLAVAGSAVVAVTALIFVLSHRFLKSRLINICLTVISNGYALPGTVVAVGLLIPVIYFDRGLIRLFQFLGLDSPGLLVSGSIGILLLAYSTKFSFLALQSIQASYAKIRTSFDEIGRSLGHKPKAIFELIHFPLIKNSILTAMILVFVDILKELPATLILRPFNFNTLAVRTYELASDERLWESSPSALAIVLVGIIPVYLLNRSMRKISNEVRSVQ